MNKVITINLNGRAYQLEETGYEAIQKYLNESEAKLSEDPDKTEIMKDLEQAISEKMDRFLTAHKTVVTETEVSEIIKEMGPVQAPESGQESQDNETKQNTGSSAKRLYKIRKGAMFRGVCAGLAAYFDIDVTLVRIIFVILTLLTHGVWILVYFIMMLVIPEAENSQQTAQAFGQPFTAQDLVNRARQEYHKFADSGKWKQWEQQHKDKIKQQKWERRQQRRSVYQAPFAMGIQSAPYSPFLNLFMALFSVAWVFGLISIVTKGEVLGFAVPAGIPLWIAVLAWVCLYGFIMAPLKAARFGISYSNGQGGIHYQHHDGGFPEAMAWLAFFVIAGWALWQYVPGSHIYFQKTQAWAQHLTNSIRHKF